MTWRIVVEGIPPTPNRSRRQHWAQNGATAASWRMKAQNAAHECIDEHGGVIPHLDKVRMVLWVCPKTRNRRDPDNALAACKPCIDGLVDAGILRDDSFDVVQELVVRRYMSPSGARIVFEIEDMA